MKSQIVRDVAGNVIYRGQAKSLKAFIENLVAEGKPLSRADLHGCDLSHLRLDRVRLDGANLAGAKLTGASCRHGDFSGADMRGVVASGLKADRSDFRRADLSPLEEDDNSPGHSVLAGAILSFSRFDGAILDYADFTNASMSSSRMVGATARRVVFRNARLHNVDWSHATVIRCDFQGARMDPTYNVDVAHLPNRTIGASIVGNRLRGARLGHANDDFKTDRALGAVGDWSIGIGTSVSMIMLGSILPMDADADLVRSLMAPSAGVIVVTTALGIIKEKISDALKDAILEVAARVWLHSQAAMMAIPRWAMALANVAVAFVSRSHARLVSEAIRAVGGPRSLHRIGTVLGGNIEIIVCGRKHLAMALTRISDAYRSTGRQFSPVVLLRKGVGDPKAPHALAFGTDGSITAFWKGDQPDFVRWGADGSASGPRARFTDPAAARRDTLKRFADAILTENGAADMAIDFDTHAVRVGMDGSVVVVRSSDGLIDNRLGPAILTPWGEGLMFRANGFRGRATQGSRQAHVRGAANGVDQDDGRCKDSIPTP